MAQVTKERLAAFLADYFRTLDASDIHLVDVSTQRSIGLPERDRVIALGSITLPGDLRVEIKLRAPVEKLAGLIAAHGAGELERVETGVTPPQAHPAPVYNQSGAW